jgi:hypothetical protein
VPLGGAIKRMKEPTLANGTGARSTTSQSFSRAIPYQIARANRRPSWIDLQLSSGGFAYELSEDGARQRSRLTFALPEHGMLDICWTRGWRRGLSH